MTLKQRIAAFWLAWKWVLILGAMLAASLWGNWHQFKQALTANLRIENKALTDALDVTTQLARERMRDDTQLLADLDAIATRGQQVRVVYRKAAAAKPLPAQCAPGQARIDAVNRGLGPITPRKDTP